MWDINEKMLEETRKELLDINKYLEESDSYDVEMRKCSPMLWT